MTKEVKVGVAWFEPDQWEYLKAVSVDSTILEPNYEDWRSNIEKTIQEMRAGGLPIQKVHIDVHDLVDWCKAEDIQVDGNARSEFAAYKLKQTSGE